MPLATKTTSDEGFRGRIDRVSNQSAANTAMTVSVPSGQLRRLLFVTVKYSGAASVTVTTTLNSGVGSAFDTLLDSEPLVTATDYLFVPDEEVLIADDDAIDVLAPAVVGETSSITIYTQVL